MPQVSRTVVVNVKPDEFAKVLDDFESYVDFLPEVKAISTSNPTETSVDVHYEIDVIKRIKYTIRIVKDGLNRRWSLVKGDLFKVNSGSWVLKPEGDGSKTHATYTVDLQFGGFIPVPQAITSKLTEQSLPALLENFKKQAEKVTPKPAA